MGGVGRAAGVVAEVPDDIADPPEAVLHDVARPGDGVQSVTTTGKSPAANSRHASAPSAAAVTSYPHFCR